MILSLNSVWIIRIRKSTGRVIWNSIGRDISVLPVSSNGDSIRLCLGAETSEHAPNTHYPQYLATIHQATLLFPVLIGEIHILPPIVLGQIMFARSNVISNAVSVDEIVNLRKFGIAQTLVAVKTIDRSRVEC